MPTASIRPEPASPEDQVSPVPLQEETTAAANGPHAISLSLGRLAMRSDNDTEHWRKTTRLMLTHLAVWFFFGYVVHMFVAPLNKIIIPVLGFPLGFYMAAQGSLIVFVVMLFMFAKQQDRIDREHGVAEDD
jgi:putative solute:sodium symporter small subunit